MAFLHISNKDNNFILDIQILRNYIHKHIKISSFFSFLYDIRIFLLPYFLSMHILYRPFTLFEGINLFKSTFNII